MPVYAYKGVTAGNRSTRGMIDADSARSARTKLTAEGIFPTQLHEGAARTPLSEALPEIQLPTLRGVPDLALALFTSQLATLLAAGVPLVESLGALTEQIENPKLRQIVAELRATVNEGSSLADALAEHEETFDNLYQSMVRAGESAGALELVLRRLADYVDSRRELRNKISGALTYPIVMLIASAIVLGILLVKVIPTISQLLSSMQRELPPLTKLVIAASDFLRDWWMVLLVGIIATVIGFNWAVNTAAGRLIWDRIRLSMPIVGRTARYISVARFARTLATLLSGGVSIVQALDIASTGSGNRVISNSIEEAKVAITRGASIAAPLRSSGHFPPMVTHMISVGEASGDLAGMLGKVSDTYDELVENSLNRMTTLLGPLLLIAVAGIVVLVVLSTLLPLMDLTSNF